MAIKINYCGFDKETAKHRPFITVLIKEDAPYGSPIIFTIEEGSGANLSDDDVEEGYIDYADIYSYEYDPCSEAFTNIADQMLMCKEIIQYLPNGIVDLIPDAMENLELEADEVWVI